MDTDVQEYMVLLRQNVAELQSLGKDWGMTDSEINDCIDRSLEEESFKEIKEGPKTTARKIWLWIRRVLRWSFWITLALVLVSIVLYIATLVHPSTEFFISGLLQPYGYAIFRTIRLASLPVHKYFNISNLYDSECLVDNPWFQEPEFECEYCENVKRAELMDSTDNETLIAQFMLEAKPILFKELAPSVVTYEDLKKMYHKNKKVMDKSVYFFQSSVVGMNTIEDMFTDDMAELLPTSDGVSIHWQTKNVPASKAIRKLFPRPGFVPADSEVALEKTVFLDGPKSDHYELASAFMQMGWYTQAHGNRKVLLTPVRHCRTSCSAIHVHLKARDIVMFNPTIWKVVMLPNLEDISIGFMGSFSAPQIIE